LFLGFSLCLHSNTVSQGFDELVKLDPFFVANTITIKADDLERLPVSWLHTTLKGGIRQSCVSYPLSAFLAMNSDKDFAAGISARSPYVTTIASLTRQRNYREAIGKVITFPRLL